MNSEQDMIRTIYSAMPRSQNQKNGLFESDAEIIQWENRYFLFSIDDFSSEDLFLINDPFILGWNCAAGTISDMAASGGTPVWYMHSMTADPSWSEEFIKMFSQGVASVLERTGTKFIGGDYGKGATWHYTGSVAGTSENAPLLRKGAQEGDSIYITGPVGEGNLQALFSLIKNNDLSLQIFNLQFKTRIDESNFIKDFATSCIDTSDGLFNALHTIGKINNTGYIIESILYSKQCREAAQALSLPIELFFFGECGEYELLFTVPHEKEEDMLLKAQAYSFEFIKIGTVTHSDTKKLITHGNEIDLSSFVIHARDYDDIHEYINTLHTWLKEKS
jgi:thiamine-monophosphate kinase